MKINKLPYSEFVSIYSKVPRLCVEVVLLTDGGVVLTKRSIEPLLGWWHLPGGTVLYNETLEHAVKRVAKEELGVNVKIEKMLGYIEYLKEQGASGLGWTISMAFLCNKKSGVLRGSEQGEIFKVFKKTLPSKIISSQKKFLLKNKII
ncbi:MAG: hypothetical protein US62_C0003G0025 [Candidatus Woesebacteria bacterium GW2011_GWA1_37_8]|uniref:Nudix hydrolase domain-containing protein n=2 Tax=Candidatus Woeseibacteriota TaxID=1752722 RepID=A0A0G0L9T2_9BACT|nr:MAG: hypothetical protein US39_C0010G0024 [Microgenomates group bacterium GW2011_GWC1_37_12b]KKQ46276.1 MAG: hypothetical protein US62_C0003G0025 [Candidatus Woesebacteria bacterium GW2011_GWA1_37_8]KKQ87762.1 MAG: hypothetical protein UT10_C0001G0003 [Candidatus Woesebacteria bacterium GW2011_GWB1_38_8b]